MFPLNDTEKNRYSNFPLMTVLIILINTMIFGYEFWLMKFDWVAFRMLVRYLGIVPQVAMSPQGWGTLSSLISMFLHGSLLHLVGNMSALWVFGRRVEDACGGGRFLLFYLLCGVCGDIADILIHRDSFIPSIGASGAIAGVMGAYLMLFPGGRIRTMVFLGWLPVFPKIHAFWILGYFLIFNIIPAIDILINKSDYYSVGYWAHLGGFFACFSIFFFLRPEAFHRYFSKLPV